MDVIVYAVRDPATGEDGVLFNDFDEAVVYARRYHCLVEAQTYVYSDSEVVLDCTKITEEDADA